MSCLSPVTATVYMTFCIFITSFLLCCRCLDILELTEHEDLRKFHYHTLKLYCALCALGNTRVTHALCSHLDQSQLLYTIDNQYLSGVLREGFYDVLIRCVAVQSNGVCLELSGVSSPLQFCNSRSLFRNT